MLFFRKLLKSLVVEWIPEQIVDTIEVLTQEHSAVTSMVNPQISFIAIETSSG